jgi:hypothetical protein
MIILIGLVFLNRISDDRPTADSQYYSPLELIPYFVGSQGTMFVSICVPILSGIFSVALVFPEEREMFYKEVSAKIYYAFPYYLSKVIPKAIGIVLCQIVYVVGCYWMVGFSYDLDKFVKYGKNFIIFSTFAMLP